MVDIHVVAEPQGDGSALMKRTGSHPGFASFVHHVTIPINDKARAIIWWPYRLASPQQEQAHNEVCVQSIKEDLKGKL